MTIDKVNAFLNDETMSTDDILEALQNAARINVEDESRLTAIITVDDTAILADDMFAAIHRRFECVEVFGGECQGDSRRIVFRDKETNQQYKFEYKCQSYHGFNYDCGTWYKIKPKKVPMIQYVIDKYCQTMKTLL